MQARIPAPAVVVLAALALAGCTSSTRSGTPAPSSSPSASAPAVSAEQLVARVTLSAADLPSGETTSLLLGGDQVQGQVTLDNCGYRFTTEAHRVARRQVKILTADGGDTGIANEVVAYDSADEAAKALAEFRTSVRQCPRNVFVPSTVAAVPALRYDVSSLTTDPALPVPDNTDATLAVTAQGSNQHLYGMLVFQRRGTVLDGVYLQSLTPPTAAVVAAVRALARVAGTKLASQ